MTDKRKGSHARALGQRIHQVRKTAGLNQSQLGQRLGISQGHIADLERGRSSPSDLLLRAIWREFFVNEHWLRTGEGPMYEFPERLDYAMARVYAKLYLELQDALGPKLALLEGRKPGDPAVPRLLMDMAADLGLPPSRPEAAFRVMTLHEARKTLSPQEIKESWAEVPLVPEAAAAGDPRLVPGELVEDWMLAPRRWVKHERYACIRVRGKSMLPVLAEGDIVAVNHDRRDLRRLRGRVVAFEVPEEGVTLKYGGLVDGIVYMCAENRLEWPERAYRADRVTVIGAVEWAWRRFE